MVVHLGIRINYDNFSVLTFNTVTKENIDFKIPITREKLKSKTVCNNFFLNIKEKVGEYIGCCCIGDGGIDNEKIRANILKIGENHGFLKIEFMSYLDASYIYALYSNNITPKVNDVIWKQLEGFTLSSRPTPNCANYGIFQKNYVKSKFLKTTNYINVCDKNALALFSPPNILLNWKRSNTPPLEMSVVNEVFPYCKILTVDANDNDQGFLLKAKMMSGNKELLPLDVEMGLSNNIELQINKEKILIIPDNLTFPFIKSILVFNSAPHKDSQKLQIKYTDNHNEEPETFSLEGMSDVVISVIADPIGIYSVKILPKNETHLEGLNNFGTKEIFFFDVSLYFSNLTNPQSFIITSASTESQIILLFDSNVNVENYLMILFGRRKIIKIDVKEVQSIYELKGIPGKQNGYLLNFVNEPIKFADVAYIFENVDQCKNENVKEFLKALFNERTIDYEKFYSPLHECLMAVTVNKGLFLTENIGMTSAFISEKPFKDPSIYKLPTTSRDTLKIESYRQIFAVTKAAENFTFNIPYFPEQTKTEMILELNEIFQKVFIRKSFYHGSDFTSMVESEIEEMLPSYPDLHRWLSASSHPTKKVFCYSGDSIHFTLLDSENIQLNFFETSEKLILIKNVPKFDSIFPFQYLPNMTMHVHQAFINPVLLQDISIKIENIYMDQFDKRAISEISSTIAQELTAVHEKPWNCFILNSSTVFEYNFPAEFIHYLIPSQGMFYSLMLYCQIIPLNIKSFIFKPKSKIIGTFLNDDLQNYGNTVLTFLFQNNMGELRISLSRLFQTEEFNMISGLSIEGFEFCKENFVFNKYIYISCNDITFLAFN